uniref:Uncharacterized protein n=1 Tax=Mycena chlorophos TaxID=658473 RepID=A0ABQ0L3G5_MYCCL|nr:predicted protein [Mycena chlorophos]
MPQRALEDTGAHPPSQARATPTMWTFVDAAIAHADDLPDLQLSTNEESPRYPNRLNARSLLVWRAFEMLKQSRIFRQDRAIATQYFGRIWRWCLFFLQAGHTVLMPLAQSRQDVVRGCALLVAQALVHDSLLRVLLESPGGVAFLVECLSLAQREPKRRGLVTSVMRALWALEAQDFDDAALSHFSASDSFIAQVAVGGLRLASTSYPDAPVRRPAALLSTLRFILGCTADPVNSTSLYRALVEAGVFGEVAKSIRTLCEDTYVGAHDRPLALEYAFITLAELAARRETDTMWAEVFAADFLHSLAVLTQMDGAQVVLAGLLDLLVGTMSRSLWMPRVLDALHGPGGLSGFKGVDLERLACLGPDFNRVWNCIGTMEQQMRLQDAVAAVKTVEKNRKMCENVRAATPSSSTGRFKLPSAPLSGRVQL